MADEKSAAPQPLPFGKACLMVLAALCLVVGVSVPLTMLDLCIWVVWLGMALWASIGGMKVEMGEIAKCWISGAEGITMGYLLTHGQAELGTWALVLAGCIVLVFVFGMVSHRFPFLSNNYTAIFLTVCTAQGLTLEPKQLALSLLFGFCAFGVVPLLAVKVLANRKR